MFLEFIRLLFYSFILVIISKYILVVVLRKLAETLNLKAKTIGNISGYATSVPELLTIIFSAITGFIETTMYNVISSNIINLVQYLLSVILNKNGYILKNMALKIDIILVLVTILIPILIITVNIGVTLNLVPIFILLFSLFYYINNNAHKLYLEKFEKKVYEEIEEEAKWLKGKRKKTFKYAFSLIITSIILFFIGNEISNSLKSLCLNFNVKESILGIILGFVTSVPELITFVEAQRYYKNNSEAGVVEATNNLLSSNILNLFLIQAIGIIIYNFVINQ